MRQLWSTSIEEILIRALGRRGLANWHLFIFGRLQFTIQGTDRNFLYGVEPPSPHVRSCLKICTARVKTCSAAPHSGRIIDLDRHALPKRPQQRSSTPWWASRRRARRRCACQRMPPCRTCTRTHATHTSAHAHTRTHTHPHTHTHSHARTLQLTAKHTPTAKHCAVSLIQAWLAVHGRFDRFSGVQGTSCLRI